MNEKKLTKKQAIKKLESLGFIESTFQEWDNDTITKDNVKTEQFYPFEVNFNNCLKELKNKTYKKFYIVGISRGRKKEFEIRAWTV